MSARHAEDGSHPRGARPRGCSAGGLRGRRAWTKSDPVDRGVDLSGRLRTGDRLKNHGVQDIRGDDTIKDIDRLERLVVGTKGGTASFTITNDPTYRRPTTHGRTTNASAFRLAEGTTLSGPRAWRPNTDGTMKNRAEPIQLSHGHTLSWRDHSRLPGSRGDFRALVVVVP